MQKQIGVAFIAKTGDGGSVNGNAIFKSTGKFLWHNGYIFLFAEYIAKGETDELYILFAHILDYLFFGILHKPTCFLLICCIHLFVWVFTIWRNDCKRLG